MWCFCKNKKAVVSINRHNLHLIRLHGTDLVYVNIPVLPCLFCWKLDLKKVKFTSVESIKFNIIYPNLIWIYYNRLTFYHLGFYASDICGIYRQKKEPLTSWLSRFRSMGPLVCWLSSGTVQLGLGFVKTWGNNHLTKHKTGCTTWNNSNPSYFDIKTAPNIPAEAEMEFIHKHCQKQE